MIAFAGMCVKPAQDAGMAVPEDPENFDKEVHPHFHVFTACQLGASMPYPGVVFDNAKVVAAIPEKEIRFITWTELEARGFSVGTPPP